MNPKRKIAIKIVTLIIIIAIGFSFIAYGLITAPSLPEEPLYYQKMLPNNVGNVVVLMYPQKAYVVNEDVLAIVAVSLSNDYVAKHDFVIDICFPDAIVKDIDYLNRTWEKQDAHLLLNETKHVNNDSLTYYRPVILRYYTDGIYGLNVTFLNFDTHTSDIYSYPAVVKINPSIYLKEKIRSDSTYALNYEILGLTIIMLAPIFIQLFSLTEKIKETKVTANNEMFIGDDR